MMKDQKEVKKELITQDAKLLYEQQGRVAPWDLPEGYLDQLAGKVLQRSSYRHAVVRQMKWIAAAAIVVAVSGIWWFYSGPLQTEATLAETNWDAISTEEMQAYVSNNIDEFELNLLAESARDFDGDLELPGEQGISTEALEQYLETEEDWLEDLDDAAFF